MTEKINSFKDTIKLSNISKTEFDLLIIEILLQNPSLLSETQITQLNQYRSDKQSFLSMSNSKNE